jgi:hypothetical protein
MQVFIISMAGKTVRVARLFINKGHHWFLPYRVSLTHAFFSEWLP